MKKVMQTKFGAGVGNCTEACWATIMGVPLEEVPDLSLHGVHRWMALLDWLRPLGLSLCRFPTTPEKGAQGFWIAEDEPYVVAGMGPRGLRHAVVYRNGQLWHDPHPSGEGITAIDSIMVLVPLASAVRNMHKQVYGC